MKAAAICVVLFLYWSVVGSAVLTALYGRRNVLRNLLLAPAMGTAVVLLPVFWLSRLGIPVGRFGWPLAIVLGAGAGATLWRCRRRPIVPWRRAAPFAATLAAALLLGGTPMLEFGTNWLSYGNNDMANYVLAAHRFHDFGFFDVPETRTYVENRDATVNYWFMHVVYGVRPGSELLLAFAITVTGLDGYRIFMPVIFSLHLGLIAAGAGLVLRSKKYRGPALLTAVLLAGCGLLALGAIYQLHGQVFGLGLATAGAVVLLRPFPRVSGRRAAGQAVVISVLLAAAAITYPEIVPFLAAGFLAWQGRAAVWGRARVREGLAVWGLAAALLVVWLNWYLPDAVSFLQHQAGSAARSAQRAETLFPFYLVPSGLANLWSLLGIAERNGDWALNAKVALGALLTVALVYAAGKRAWRGEPAAVMAGVMLAVGAVLFATRNSFGLYKLAMFIQPFLAGTMALAVMDRRRDWRVWAATAVVLGLSLHSQYYYVDRSRARKGGLVEIPGASDSGLIDEAGRLAELPAGARVTSDTFNVVVGKVQALYLRGRPLEFYTRDFFPAVRLVGFRAERDEANRPLNAVEEADRLSEMRLRPYKLAPFDLKQGGPRASTEFLLNESAQQRQGGEGQYLLASSGRQEFVNRRRVGDWGGNFKAIPMPEVKNHLVFVSSELGQSYYSNDRRHAAFFQLEPDLAYAGRTMSSTGRYLLFELLNGTPGGRIVLDYTTTWNIDHDNALPPAEVVGERRYALPIRGRGAARVVSPPVVPQRIGGREFLAIDMGRDGKTLDAPRRGLMKLYGQDTLLDIRWITGFARDLSYLAPEEYEQMRPPAGIESFPDGLLARDLEYTGVYEDGWVSEASSYTFTQTADRPELVVRGFIPRIKDAGLKTEAVLTVDGVETKRVLAVGEFELRAAVGYRSGRRAVGLTFSTRQSLPDPDNRPVSAKIRSIGFVGLATGREDIVTKASGITLGGGWYGYEKYNGQGFRWMDNDATFGTREPVELEVEPGPGIGRLPAKVEIAAEGGEVVSREVYGRARIHLDGAARYRIHVVNGGRRIASDPRRLNLRVFGITAQSEVPDIVLRGVSLRTQTGWHAVETQNGERFRWADTDAGFTMAAPGRVRVDVEPGPSLGGRALDLKVLDAAGRQAAGVKVTGRRKVTLELKAAGAYRFAVDSPRRAVPGDARILNFRVWEMTVQSP